MAPGSSIYLGPSECSVETKVEDTREGLSRRPYRVLFSYKTKKQKQRTAAQQGSHSRAEFPEGLTPGEPYKNDELWVIMTCQCRFISYMSPSADLLMMGVSLQG